MKENEKKVSVLFEDGDKSKNSNLDTPNKNSKERLKKPVIFLLMGIVFLGCMYLIFKPSPDKTKMESIGLNDAVPQASEAGMQSDKQKAYEQEMLEEKDREKRNGLTSLSDYWNEDTSASDKQDSVSGQDEITPYSSPRRPDNPALYSYRNNQKALGSFYKDDNAETTELRKQLDEMKEKLADKDIPKPVTVDDQLALMEKSYQMAAKYLPAGTSPAGAETVNAKTPSSAPAQKEYFVPFTPAGKNTVSSLYRESSDNTFLSDGSSFRNRNFYTAGSAGQGVQPKNSVKACVHETQLVAGEIGVKLRLLEPAQTPQRTIPKGTIVTAASKFQGGRLQLKITSIELDGSIIPVEITVYDLDGQQGLYVPYSPEVNALSEMAGNMSQTGGTSIMLTQSAGQQMAADLSRGVVQGVSGYFSKKVKTPKVTVKAGHELFLVSKK